MTDDTVLTDLKSKFRRFLELRVRKDEAKKAFEKADAAYKEAQSELYTELEDAGTRGTFTFDFGAELGEAKFGRRATNYGQVIDKATAIQSLKRVGWSDAVIEEGIADGRLNEHVRDMLDMGQELPDGVGFRTQKIITVSRKKPGKSSDALSP